MLTKHASAEPKEETFACVKPKYWFLSGKYNLLIECYQYDLSRDEKIIAQTEAANNSYVPKHLKPAGSLDNINVMYRSDQLLAYLPQVYKTMSKDQLFPVVL